MNDLRQWIDIAKVLNEAPIGDIQTHGDFSRPGSFRADDLSLTTPKRQEKIRRVLQKAPVLINLHFVNQPHQVDMKWHLDPVHARQALGFLTPKRMEEQYGFSIKPQANAVSVVMIQNEGTDRVPMTPWIIAHRIGHLFLYTHPLTIDNIFKTFFSTLEKVDDEYEYNTHYHPGWPELAKVFGTTRACREGLIVTSRIGEWIYDSFAQLCVTGNIKFNPAPAAFDKYHTDDPAYVDRRFVKLRDFLIDRFTWMLNDAVGKIMVF